MGRPNKALLRPGGDVLEQGEGASMGQDHDAVRMQRLSSGRFEHEMERISCVEFRKGRPTAANDGEPGTRTRSSADQETSGHSLSKEVSLDSSVEETADEVYLKRHLAYELQEQQASLRMYIDASSPASQQSSTEFFYSQEVSGEFCLLDPPAFGFNVKVPAKLLFSCLCDISISSELSCPFSYLRTFSA